MKKYMLLLVILSMILLSFSINGLNVVAEDPYTVYGSVKDENGAAVAGAQITIENSNTNEKNSVGGDTITGNPISITSDSEGDYIFEIINLKSGYSNGDEIIVTAERDDMIGSESTIVDNGSWGTSVDINMESEQELKEKDQWYASFSDPLTFLLLLALIIAVILILILLKRRKGPEPEDRQFEEPVEREDDSGKAAVEEPEPEERQFEEPVEREEDSSKAAVEEPEHEGRQFEEPVEREELSKEVAEEEPESERQNSLIEESLAYECPECGYEIKEEDTSCSNCGVAFAETED